MFKILNYDEREALKQHSGCDGGEFPDVCHQYWLSIWHRQLDYIYGKPPRWSPKLRDDIHFETWVSDDVEPTFEDYKKEILKSDQTSFMEKYENKSGSKSLRKKYVIKDVKIIK